MSLVTHAKYVSLAKSTTFMSSRKPAVPQSLPGDWLHNWSLGGKEKIVLYIAASAYSVVVIVVAVFILLPS